MGSCTVRNARTCHTHAAAVCNMGEEEPGMGSLERARVPCKRGGISGSLLWCPGLPRLAEALSFSKLVGRHPPSQKPTTGPTAVASLARFPLSPT